MVTVNCVHERANRWRPAKICRRGASSDCTAASRFIFDVEIKVHSVAVLGRCLSSSPIAYLKSNIGRKSAGYPPWAPTDAIFLVANLFGASGEAIGAFPHFARVFSSVAQSKRLVGERSCHASHSLW